MKTFPIAKCLSLASLCLLFSDQVTRAEEPKFKVTVLFGGLIAFTEAKNCPFIGANSSCMLALLPDLDYNLHNVREDELPPGARFEDRAHYPPHYSALRVFRSCPKEGGLCDEFGDQIKSGVPVPLDGTEITFSTESKNTTEADLTLLANMQTIKDNRIDLLSANVPDRAGLVDKDYIGAPPAEWFKKAPHLSSRVIIIGGEAKAEVSKCLSSSSTKAAAPVYHFSDGNPDGIAICKGKKKAVELGEVLRWWFKQSAPIEIRLDRGDDNPRTLVISPFCDDNNKKCGDITIEIVNSTDGRDVKQDTTLLQEGDCGMGHYSAFKAYYWLSSRPFSWLHYFTPPVPYYVPCDASAVGVSGGTRCPMLLLEEDKS